MQFLSGVFTPTHPATTAVSAPTCHLSICLFIGLERFFGSQKENERGHRSILFLFEQNCYDCRPVLTFATNRGKGPCLHDHVVNLCVSMQILKPTVSYFSQTIYDLSDFNITFSKHFSAQPVLSHRLNTALGHPRSLMIFVFEFHRLFKTFTG